MGDTRKHTRVTLLQDGTTVQMGDLNTTGVADIPVGLRSVVMFHQFDTEQDAKHAAKMILCLIDPSPSAENERRIVDETGATLVLIYN